RTGDAPRTVGRHRHANHQICVAPEGKKLSSGPGVPHPRRLGEGPSDDARTVRGHRHANHQTGVARAGEGLDSLPDCPHPPAVAPVEPASMDRPWVVRVAFTELLFGLVRVSGPAPVLVPRLRALRAKELVTIRVPSGVTATLLTAPVWPERVKSSAPVLASHTRAVWSPEPVPGCPLSGVTISAPTGLTATLTTRLARPLLDSSSTPVWAYQTPAVGSTAR